MTMLMTILKNLFERMELIELRQVEIIKALRNGDEDHIVEGIVELSEDIHDFYHQWDQRVKLKLLEGEIT